MQISNYFQIKKNFSPAKASLSDDSQKLMWWRRIVGEFEPFLGKAVLMI